MPGKICWGQPDEARYWLKNSMSYCEGRAHAAAGGSLGYATGETGTEVANNGLTWTNLIAGNGGAVRLVHPGIADSPLSFSRLPGSLTVRLATDSGQTITTIANDIVALFAGDPIVDVANTGASTGLGLVEVAYTILTVPGGSVGNHHFAGSEEAVAFEAGFDSWTADPAGAGAPPGGQDCCARPYGGGYTPP